MYYSNRKILARCLLPLLIVLLIATAFAIPEKSFAPPLPIEYPKNCKATGYEFFNNALRLRKKSNEPTRLYLIYNQSGYEVIIDRVKKDPGADAGWATELQPHHWLALLMNDTSFHLTCIRPKDDSKQYQSGNCSQLLKICTYEKIDADTPDKLAGNYWVVENKLLPELFLQIHQRGIIIN